MKKCQRAACGRGTLIISPDGVVGLAAGAHEDFAVPAVVARVSPKYRSTLDQLGLDQKTL